MNHESRVVNSNSDAVEGSKEKVSLKGRGSHPDVFCKKGAVENFSI